MRKLVLLLLLACAACTTRADAPAVSPAASPVTPQTAQPAASAPASTNTLAQITGLIGKAACTSDQQCQVLPVGARPCGGPASYLAWSSAATSGADLQALADRYRSEQQAGNSRSGMVSDCRAIAPPAAACRAGACQLIDAVSAQ
ncbi:hypothetical protein LK540_18580 [Massilia sp. IC2-278]|uniref:hypothetical protein n=1 Tax=Massilia sp. IC2-278 TaxID=2887200 RepID=UPI001E367AE5|nr:hypothetical protein [Massilia sp. IC2-278]MCC2962437.1 hypothetical protein [Massilia sp. IC2-278]